MLCLPSRMLPWPKLESSPIIPNQQAESISDSTDSNYSDLLLFDGKGIGIDGYNVPDR